MKCINKVTLIGLVGQDPQVKYTADNVAIANFSLATSKKNKKGDSVTQWHSCTAFGKTWELVESYVKKGTKLYIEGEIQYQEYEKDGDTKKATKIVVNDMSFLGDNNTGSQPKNKQEKLSMPLDAFDDSIPF